ncbi:putative microtubule associated protein [Cryptosporidium canis]|uniref:Microtubule associated protein n=1 Tax=Cryptosporidium canis TaxID=195482 RepID=A0ABQ8PC24_9CRYT|nr:putative microtubule associated protein [Cryptosporidium canis]KAJ1614115.1 putative microtubule associated protein [Cryptosporidium canis]
MEEDEMVREGSDFLQFRLRGRGMFSGGPNSPDNKCFNSENNKEDETMDSKADLESQYSMFKIIRESSLEELAYFQEWDIMFSDWVNFLHSRSHVADLIKYIVGILENLTRKIEQECTSNTESFAEIIIEKILSNMLCKHLITSKSNDSECSGRVILNTNIIYELILHLSDSCLKTYSETMRCVQKIIHFSQLEFSNGDFCPSKNAGSGKSREYLIDGLIMQLCKLVQHQSSIIRIEVVGILIYAILAVPMSSKYPYNPTRIVQALVWSIYDDEEEVVYRSIDGLRVYLSVVGNEYFNTVISLAVDAIPEERKQNSLYNPLRLLHQRILENAQLPDIEDGSITFADFNISHISNSSNNQVSKIGAITTSKQTSENTHSGNNNRVPKLKQKTVGKEANISKASSKPMVRSTPIIQPKIREENNLCEDVNIGDFPESNSFSDEKLEVITKNATDFLLNTELYTENWNRIVEEITNLRRVIIYHSLFLTKSGGSRSTCTKNLSPTIIGESIARWICSLRSCVSKSAMQGIEDLYIHCGSSLDLGKLLDICLEKILKRTSDRNKFIANDATKTLIAICSIKAGDKLLGKLISHGSKNRSTVVVHNSLKATAVVLEKIGPNISKCSNLFQCLEFIHGNINGPTPDIRTYSKVCIKIILDNSDWKSIVQSLRKSVAQYKLESIHKDFENAVQGSRR